MIIFTANKSLDASGRVLHDEDLAAAIVDRVLERGRLLKLNGPSMRTRHPGLDDPLRRSHQRNRPELLECDRQNVRAHTRGA
jgi:hypothetical protein